MTVLEKRLLARMQKQGLPITFSMGILTCITAPSSMDVLFKRADELMYAAKKQGKNAIRYGTFENQQSSHQQS